MIHNKNPDEEEVNDDYDQFILTVDDMNSHDIFGYMWDIED